MARRGIDDYLEDRRRDLQRLGGGSKPTPKPKATRVVKMTRAGQIRAGSVGVSSSSRQRTHKRGPQNRSRYK